MTMAIDDDELARLTYEAIAQLGDEADAEAVANRVKRLDKGLPAEDEFMVVNTWLGQCPLIHKLDQVQMPPDSAKKYQVPDLLASFAVNDKQVAVLIEVKTSRDNVLSFRPDYYGRLGRYSELLGLPLLIAWKWRGVWCLFEATHMVQRNKNYNINWQTALQENLLGLLAGDFSYVLGEGVGIHIRFRKAELVETSLLGDETEEKWTTQIDDVYYTNNQGERIEALDARIQAAVMIAELDENTEVTDTHILQHFTAPEDTGLFAHAALVRMLSFRDPKAPHIHWRSHTKDASALKSISGFKETVTEGIAAGVVRYVFTLQPKTKPKFIP